MVKRNDDEIEVATNQMIHSEGWDCLVTELNDRLAYIDLEASKSIEPNMALACFRERLGILFVIERAKELAGEA